jgi:hypothetical protein
VALVEGDTVTVFVWVTVAVLVWVTVAVLVWVTVAVPVFVTVAVFVWVTVAVSVAVSVAPGRVAVGRSAAVSLVDGLGGAAGVSTGVSEAVSVERVLVGRVRVGTVALDRLTLGTAVGSVIGPLPLHPAAATRTTVAARALVRCPWRLMGDCAVRRPTRRVTLAV